MIVFYVYLTGVMVLGAIYAALLVMRVIEDDDLVGVLICVAWPIVAVLALISVVRDALSGKES